MPAFAWQALWAKGMRTVRLPASELANLDTLALSLSQHSSIYFVVLAPLLTAATCDRLFATLSGEPMQPAGIVIRPPWMLPCMQRYSG